MIGHCLSAVDGRYVYVGGGNYALLFTGIPCELASLVRVPLRFAKGRKAACSAFLWMNVPSAEAPAFRRNDDWGAGMTVGGAKVSLVGGTLSYYSRASPLASLAPPSILERGVGATTRVAPTLLGWIRLCG